MVSHDFYKVNIGKYIGKYIGEYIGKYIGKSSINGQCLL